MRWLYSGCCAAALALFAAAYGNVYHNDFYFDDGHVLVDNLSIRSLRNTPDFFTDARTFSSLPANATYRPLCSLSLALDYAIAGGLDPVIFHASQLAQMALLSIVILFLYRRILDAAQPNPWNRYFALGGATFFAVHTLNSEVMNLMHARSEILSALGVVGAFLIYLQAGRARQIGLHHVAMIAGALAKPPAVIFGPLLFLWVALESRWRNEDVRTSKSPWQSAGRRALAAAIPSTIAGALTYLVISQLDASTQTYGGGDRYPYALTQVWAWLHYLRLFVLPLGLTADTDLQLIRGWYDTRVVAGGLAIATLLWAASRAARSERAWPIAFGIGWFVLGLAPTSSIIPLAEPINEHRPFLALIGLVLAVVWGVRLWLEPRLAGTRLAGKARIALPAAFCIAVLIAHAAGTHRRNEIWRDGASLWGDVTRKSPGNGRGWMNYGLTFMSNGKWSEARSCFERALALTPTYYTVELNLGVLEGATGNQEKAEQHFHRALGLAPDAPDAHFFFARWLVDQGRGPEAIEHLWEATRLTPGYDSALSLLMDLHVACGDSATGRAIAQAYLAVSPRSARAQAYAQSKVLLDRQPATYDTYLQDALALTRREQFLAAAIQYRAALTFQPDSADVLNNLGFVLARLGFFAEAAAQLEEALRQKPDFQLARNNLAWVRSEFDRAPPN